MRWDRCECRERFPRKDPGVFGLLGSSLSCDTTGLTLPAKHLCLRDTELCINREQSHLPRTCTASLGAAPVGAAINDVLGSMPMRLAALLSLVLLSPGVVYAHNSHKARASDKSQEVAAAKAMRRVPEGATVTDTTCKKLNYVFQTRWRCTITYSD